MSFGALDTITSSEALVVFDADTRVVHLNGAAEVLLGTTVALAVGKTCQAVLHSRSAEGRASCGTCIRHARRARRGLAVPPMTIAIDTSAGPRSVDVSTIVLSRPEGPLLCRILRDIDSTGAGATEQATTRLTRRQLEVLRLLAQGVGARGVAARIGITEATARNHIRAILVELGVHSQLEAVARARELGMTG